MHMLGTMPPQHAPELKDVEHLVEAILIRLPPHEPETFVRASLVCKPWCSLLSDHGFRSRYRAFHKKTPPMLGFFHSVYRGAPFISTTKFQPRDPRHCYDHSVVDCRHGRALLRYFDKDENRLYLVVWDPMTGNTRKLRRPQGNYTSSCASVLCAVDGCDHVACHLGPFFVVFLTLHEDEGVATATVYSSETRTWSSRSSLHLGVFEDELRLPSITTLLTGGAIHYLFVRDALAGILKYDLGTSCLSEVELPLEIPVDDYEYYPVLIAPEEDNGRLGIADLYEGNLDLSLWRREVGPDQVAAWTQPTIINLRNHLHGTDALSWLLGCIEGTAIVFVVTDLGTYKIDLKLLPLSLNCERESFLNLTVYTPSSPI